MLFCTWVCKVVFPECIERCCLGFSLAVINPVFTDWYSLRNEEVSHTKINLRLIDLDIGIGPV